MAQFIEFLQMYEEKKIFPRERKWKIFENEAYTGEYTFQLR